jgi:hypothetical protein
MKQKNTNRIAPTMRAGASIMNYPLEILQAAKNAGCPAFQPSGRVDLDELERWMQGEWYPMPDWVFNYFRTLWTVNIKPTKSGRLGIANSIEEASRKTGLSVSMILFMRDAGSKAFID